MVSESLWSTSCFRHLWQDLARTGLENFYYCLFEEWPQYALHCDSEELRDIIATVTGGFHPWSGANYCNGYHYTSEEMADLVCAVFEIGESGKSKTITEMSDLDAVRCFLQGFVAESGEHTVDRAYLPLRIEFQDLKSEIYLMFLRAALFDSEEPLTTISPKILRVLFAGVDFNRARIRRYQRLYELLSDSALYRMYQEMELEYTEVRRKWEDLQIKSRKEYEESEAKRRRKKIMGQIRDWECM